MIKPKQLVKGIKLQLVWMIFIKRYNNIELDIYLDSSYVVLII
jgi:hypothetical protein